MIIASSHKKDVSIPLQTMSSRVPDSPPDHTREMVELAKRSKDDFVSSLFAPSSPVFQAVHEILTITTAIRHKVGGGGLLESQAFIYQRTVFLSSPFTGDHSIGLLGWSDGEFQQCITHLIELAEEKTGCEALVIAIDKHGKEPVNIMLRALMYMGFELVHPSVYQQEPGYVLVGYEL